MLSETLFDEANALIGSVCWPVIECMSFCWDGMLRCVPARAGDEWVYVKMKRKVRGMDKR